MARAVRAHSGMAAGGPGSRSKTTIRGVSRSSASAIGACSSSAAMLAAQTSAAGSSITQYWMTPLWSPGPGAVGTHAGRCCAQRFSKKPFCSTPLGKRLKVSARPARWGSITGAMRA